MSDERWVFGYGSLMWRPGFTYAERCAATRSAKANPGRHISEP